MSNSNIIVLEKASQFGMGKSTGTTIGGVDMLPRSLVHKALLNIEKIEPRFIITRFNVNPITIISFYSNDKEEVTHLYYDPSSFVRKEHNFLIIGGDLSDQLSVSGLHKFAYPVSSKRKWIFLETFIQENNLVYLTDKFQKKSSK